MLFFCSSPLNWGTDNEKEVSAKKENFTGEGNLTSFSKTIKINLPLCHFTVLITNKWNSIETWLFFYFTGIGTYFFFSENEQFLNVDFYFVFYFIVNYPRYYVFSKYYILTIGMFFLFVVMMTIAKKFL